MVPLVKEPYTKTLSENVNIQYGFQGGHVVVRVRLPIPLRPWYSVHVPSDSILKFKQNFDDGYVYGMLPESQRTRKKPVEFTARHDCRGRWGYPDGHVEIGVKKIVWIWLKFPFDEFVLGKKAMDDAYLWACLPEDVRTRQGVP